MSGPFKQVQKLAVLIVGVTVLIIGIILIPLPGPGILICFVGLVILATEFEWAAKHRDRAKAELKKLTDNTAPKQNTKKK